MDINNLNKRIINIVIGQKKVAMDKSRKGDVRAENLVAVEVNRRHAEYADPTKSYKEGPAKYEHLGTCALLTLDYYERKNGHSPYLYGKLREDAYKLQCEYGDLVMCDLYAPLGGKGTIIPKIKPGTKGMEVKYQKQAGTTEQKNNGQVKYDTIHAEDKQENSRTGEFKNGWLYSYTKVRNIVYVTHTEVLFISLEKLRNITIENPNAHSQPCFGAQTQNSRNKFDLPYNYLVQTDDIRHANGTLNFNVPEYFTH